MANKHLSLIGLIAISMLCVAPNALYAAEEAKEHWSITLRPVQYGDVKGDIEKFKAHHWIKDNYVGGIKDLLYEREGKDGTLMTFEGHALPEENDKEVEFSLTKEGLGEADIHYKMFRKYFDNSGGFSYRNSTLRSLDAGQDLDLDIGHLMISLSPDLENFHDITFLYERHTKDGKKSRLTWAEAREGARRPSIAPSWQSIDEVVNIFQLEGKTEVKGVNLSAQQRYEKVESHNDRNERWLSTAATAEQRKQRHHDERPEAEIFTTTFSGQNWFNKDKSFANVAYRYNMISNHELENILETDEFGNPANYSNSENTVNALADNDVDDHILVGQYSTNLTPNLNVAAKFKSELMIRQGESTYPHDSLPGGGAAPDGVIDVIDYNKVKNKALLFGQNFSFRYNGIKTTSIYGDIEVGEVRNNLEEIQFSRLNALNWVRETDVNTKKTVWTLGTRSIPSSQFNITTQLRRRLENNDFDDIKDSPAGAINSAFYDSMKLISNELTTKWTWKLYHWLHSSIRYQLVDSKIEARAENRAQQDSTTRSHIFTYDIVLQPTDKLFTNIAFSKQDIKTKTAANAFTSPFQLPGFNGDVSSIIFSTSYTPTETLSYTGIFTYSFSDNFNDYTASSVAYGVDNSRKSVELGMGWSPKNKNWTIEPHYAFYSHNGSAVSEYGNYNAHIAWLDITREW